MREIGTFGGIVGLSVLAFIFVTHGSQTAQAAEGVASAGGTFVNALQGQNVSGGLSLASGLG